MAEVTVQDFAKSVGISVDRLVAQLDEAGLPDRKPADVITDGEKSQLLGYLRKMHGKEETAPEPSRITLKRKTVSELKVPTERSRTRTRATKSTPGKTVSVEVRRKRTYVKRQVVMESEAARVEQEAAEIEQQQANQEPALDIPPPSPDPVVDAAVEAPVEERAESHLESAPSAADDKLAEDAAAPVPAAESQDDASVETAAAVVAEIASVPPPEVGEGEQRPNKRARGNRREGGDDARSGSKNRKELHVASEKSGRRRKKAFTPRRVVAPTSTKHGFERPTQPQVRDVQIPAGITVADLAQRMSIKAAEVIKVMMNLGSMVTINQVIDQDTAAVVVEEMGHRPKIVRENAIEEEILSVTETSAERRPRGPVVTVMGHVDHGKTSLLDYIRHSRIAAGEAGGITQHIGAYRVTTDHGAITFIDTPGHEAFTAMRARGAQATDIVVLVVAADDGVMPQTEEAIKHAKAAEVPLIVAINKVDKEDADIERIKQELANREVIPDDWGGETQFVAVSAKTGQGVNELLESISLQAELLELTAVYEGAGKGVVIESRLDKGRGPVATVLIQHGSVQRGDILLTGTEFGRVRAMLSHDGETLQVAGPSEPVEILGLSGTPNAGDEATVVEDERTAREISGLRTERNRETKLARQQAAKMENVFSQMQDGAAQSVKLLIKADVQGSAEALEESLLRLSNDEVRVEIVSSGVGGITESDANLALASGATLVGFNVRADASARRIGDEEGLSIRYYSVIYDVIDDVGAVISGMLAPEIRESIIGVAAVRDVFRSSKLGAVAGCIVSEGAVKRSNPIRVLRDNVVIYEGELESLRRFKDDVEEVKAGTECGIGVKNYNDVKPGDQIEVYERVEIARKV